MRIAFLAACFVLCAGSVLAQQQADPPASSYSTGRTVAPESKGPQQPQGHTGPLTTEGRSAPPESPQGQTPPNMHAAPEGSDKTIVEPKQ